MSNYAHRYFASAQRENPENYMTNPYDDLHVGAYFNGSSPSSFAAGVIESIHDTKVNRIITVRTDADMLDTARLKHADKGAGWVVKNPELTALSTV